MTENELIQTIAQIWVNNGGDAEGFNWCWLSIKEAIANLTHNEPDLTYPQRETESNEKGS